MSAMRFGLVLLASAAVLPAGGLLPAAAQNSHRTIEQLAAQRRPVIVVHPRRRLGPNATRHCVAWLAKRNWPNGQVVLTPQKRCWWED